VRYNLRFGPIRVDVATPVCETGKADRRVHIYVSIGQSF